MNRRILPILFLFLLEIANQQFNINKQDETSSTMDGLGYALISTSNIVLGSSPFAPYLTII